jgi:curved DNA-binding protein CbpA
VADYYKLIGVSRTATQAEIKSAYRRLARERHPDVNQAADAEREFALIAHAYRILSNPQERARYDSIERERRTKVAWNSSDSVIHSDNPHARRIRRMTAQRRWDSAVDRWIESERRETHARTQAVFTTVTLFLSTFMVAVFKPRFWDLMGDAGRFVLIGLFLVGSWHLFLRLRASFERYTYRRPPQSSDTSVDIPATDKPFTRSAASVFLIGGYALSLGIGIIVGAQAHRFHLVSDIPYLFGERYGSIYCSTRQSPSSSLT